MKETAKKRYKKPYCKEKNLLQLPVFYFEMSRRKEITYSWKEDQRRCKVSCYSNRGIPGSLEQDVYAACMRLWVKQGMPADGILIQYSDIAEVLGLKYENWKTKIKKSLLKLGAARYEFIECFIDAESRVTKSIIQQFSLFDTTAFEEINARGRKTHKNLLRFPLEIKTNLEKRYYQWLDFELYMSIKSGLARRLYEFLEKKRYHKRENSFCIAEEKLFRWLPLIDKNISSRRKTLSDAAKALIDAQYLTEYKRDKKSKLCCFTYSAKLSRTTMESGTHGNESFNLKPVIKEPTDSNEVGEAILTALFSPEVENESDKYEQRKGKELKEEHLTVLSGLLKRKTKNLNDVISKYYEQEGFDYVLWNVRYANQNAKKNYSLYLQKALAENWAHQWRQEQQINDQEVKEKVQQDCEKAHEHQEKEAQLLKERSLLKEMHDQLSCSVKEQFAQQADEEINKEQIGRNMHVKIRYAHLIREHLNENGYSFSCEAISPLKFVNEITKNTFG